MHARKLLIAATTGLTIAAAPAPEAWNVDDTHSAVTFSVRHFFTPVKGSFHDYDVELQYDAETPENSTVSARIAVASIDTGNEQRDGHVLSADFFGAEEFPYITFESTSVREAGDGRLIATGPLTIKGVTREIEMPITILGITEVPAEMQQMLGGVTRIASFEAGTTIDRRDFTVGVGSWAETAVVGADVEIALAVEANQK